MERRRRRASADERRWRDGADSWMKAETGRSLVVQRFNDKKENFVLLFVVVVDRFYIALFSAFEQTHCVRM